MKGYWPVGVITDRYGTTADYRSTPHRGIDIAAAEGQPLAAFDDGKIQINEWSDSYGWVIRIYHGKQEGHEVHTIYAHMREQSPWKAGHDVTRGQLVGFAGNTGKSLGAHLHFEVWIDWEPTNPLDYLAYLPGDS
jgi:murein DD-endopeptidase MepM/ murein hydrolase activator NlpD